MDPIKQICRFCLAEEDLLTDCTLYDDAVQAKITTVFSFPFNCEASLPSRICNGCYLKIDEYYEFTEQVRQNQEQLLAHEALAFQVNIKLESTEIVVLENPIVVKEPVPVDHQTTIIKTDVVSEEVVSDEVISDGVVHEGDEEQVVSYGSDQSIVQGQDEVLQLKIEFEDTKLQIERDPITNQVSKIAEGDRLIKEFFGLICKTCSMQFNSFTQLKQHTRLMHDKILSFTCCNKQYFHRCQLVNHIASHSNPRPFQCDSCDKSFRGQNSLTQHRIKVHSAKDGWPFKCDRCKKSYPKRYMLTEHVKTMHKNDKITCNVCNRMYPSLIALRSHMRRVHVEAMHECDICGKKLKEKIQLRTHYAAHKGEKLYTCNLCGKRMTASSSLSKHKRKKHPKEWAEMKQKDRQ